METGDWINLATAAGVAITAAFTALGFLMLRRQAKIDQPVINHRLPGKRGAGYRTLSVTIAAPENERYTLTRLEVLRPRPAQLSHITKRQDAFGEEVPSDHFEWRKSLAFAGDHVHSTGVFLKASPGQSVVIRATIALRADSRITSRRKLQMIMPD